MSEHRSTSTTEVSPNARRRASVGVVFAASVALLAACSTAERADGGPSSSQPAETTATPSASTPNNVPTLPTALPTTETTPYGKREIRSEGRYCTDSKEDRNTPQPVGNGVQPNTFTIEGGCAGNPNAKTSVYVPRSHPERVQDGAGIEATTLEDGTPFAIGCLLRGDTLRSNAEVSSDLWARGIVPSNQAMGVLDIPVHLLGLPGEALPNMIQEGIVTIPILPSPAPNSDCGSFPIPTHYAIPSN